MAQFLFAYFEGNGEDGLRLACSDDGYCWETLGAAPFLVPQIGEFRLMRDPFLMQAPDGVFHMVWTTGWTGKTIGYAASRDLRHWSAQRALPVMEHEAQARNCWAPEMIWDAEEERFLIFWSTTIDGRFPETENSNVRPGSDLNWKRNHRIYATATRDFLEFSPTALLYDGGFNVIDASMVQNGAEWLLFVKDESYAPVIQKNIRMIRAASPTGPFGAVSPPITGDYWAEGPSAIKIGDEWRVYFDKHHEGRYGVVCSRDLQTWDDCSARLQMPPEARHGNVLMVADEVIEGIRRGL